MHTFNNQHTQQLVSLQILTTDLLRTVAGGCKTLRNVRGGRGTEPGVRLC